MEEKITEQERKITNNTELSKKNEILMAKQKNESDARVQQVEALIKKQEDKTTSMLSTIFTNIIGVVKADEARTQELEGKISKNLEEKIEKQKIENKVLLQEVDEKIEKQKNENEALLEEVGEKIDKQKIQNEALLQAVDVKIDKHKNENAALLEEVDEKFDKQKNETAQMLGIIFSNITRAVNSGVASTGIKSYLTHV